jgi:TM2 domain-containing membrane protein YozV
MSHIFISYASEDRLRAKALADVLECRGWSVWWDRTISPGKEFDQVIEEALDTAGCVVVLWSTAAVASTWVKTEASEAMRRKILVPALIEDVRVPLEFRRLQAADLSSSGFERTDPVFERFLLSIESNISANATSLASPPRADEPHAKSASSGTVSPTGKTPWIPVLLSFVFVGLGQFYNGDWQKGVMMLVGAVLGLMLTGGLATIVFWIWSMYDAWQVASGKRPGWMRSKLDLSRMAIPAIASALVLALGYLWFTRS